MGDVRAAAHRLETDLLRAERGDAMDWPFRIENVRAVVDAVLNVNQAVLSPGEVLVNGKPVKLAEPRHFAEVPAGVACGASYPSMQTTLNPEEVTCQGCMVRMRP